MQIVEVIDPMARQDRLDALLKKYHASRKNRVLVFVLYKKEASRIETFLQRRGWKVSFRTKLLTCCPGLASGASCSLQQIASPAEICQRSLHTIHPLMYASPDLLVRALLAWLSSSLGSSMTITL